MTNLPTNKVHQYNKDIAAAGGFSFIIETATGIYCRKNMNDVVHFIDEFNDPSKFFLVHMYHGTLKVNSFLMNCVHEYDRHDIFMSRQKPIN